ncbi:MAG: hypothetical protein KDK41_08220 [Leptospiraceae bacterium]|nr:hypothetical protein [Leptospiraceae bacterium]
MVIKRHFAPHRIFWYVRYELIFGVLSVLFAFYLHKSGYLNVGVSLAVVGLLATSLAIFLGFRNNASYSRWWEARTLWGTGINASRIFSRQILASVHSAIKANSCSEAEAFNFAQEMIHRMGAYAHALRIHLRNAGDATEYSHLLPHEEYIAYDKNQNIPNMIMLKMAQRIKDGVREGKLGQFDPISLEPQMATIQNWQGGCERIKNTPLPRVYDFFTRIFLFTFIAVLPLAILPAMKENLWLASITCGLIIFVFSIINKSGAVLENPFDNKVNDVPLTSMTVTIERDLLEMLGEESLPKKKFPENGILM